MRYTLSDREFTFISQMIYRINTLDSYEAVSHMALKQLQTIIPFTKGIIFQIREEHQKLVYRNPVVLDPPGENFTEMDHHFMDANYRSDWLMYTSSPWSNTFRQTDIRDEETFLKSDLYRDIYKAQNVYYGLQSILVHQDHKLALVGLFRPQDAADFSPRDEFIMSSIALHLELKYYELYLKEAKQEAYSSDQAQAFRKNEDFQFYMMQKYKLTKREIETCLLISLGKSNQEIATALFISKSTLDKHLYNSYRKVGVNNRMQLVQLLLEEHGQFDAGMQG